MSKKYLSLDEAAAMLGMPREDLTRLREKGDLRGFSDRGNWKFKVEDIETLARSRQADSDPEVPMMLGDSDSGSEIHIEEEEPDVFGAFFDEEEKASPKDSSVDQDFLTNSDSDVRLVMEDDELASAIGEGVGDSDSDVKLVGDGASDSDSDVKLIDDDATIRELNMPKLEDSDSDVKLSMPGQSDALTLDRSDSDVQLLPDSGAVSNSDSDIAILGSDSAVSLDFGDDAHSDDISLAPSLSGVGLKGPSDSGILMDDDDGISLSAPSSGIGKTESGSGISLAADSGISLSAADSGISLSAADSGISLEAVADSGISLEDSHEFTGTVPMMNVVEDDDVEKTTKFEMPAIDEDSAFEMKAGKKGGKPAKKKPDTEETGVLDIGDSDSLDDGEFNLDDDDAEASAEELDVADEMSDEDEEVEDLDVFDADEAFEGEEEEEVVGTMRGRVAAAPEVSYPAWFTGLLAFSTVLSLVCGLVMYDLVASMWMWGERPAQPGMFLGMVAGLFGK